MFRRTYEVKLIMAYEYVRKNYEDLLCEINEYEKRFGRSITVVAVTKSGTDEEVAALAEAGAKDLAEKV